MLNEDKVKLMTINPQLLGTSVDMWQVKGMVMSTDDVMSDVGIDVDDNMLLTGLKEQAEQLHANAVIDVHVKVMDDDELVAYGTAVKLTPHDLGKDKHHAEH